ncbi:RteC domain-containing protein [Mucilaginibacter metallidurans]|nr:RteC domain-containing protein [Mucilaginibacter gossypii]
MNPTFETIESQLKEELLSLQNYPPMERYSASVILVNKAIADLKEHLKTTEFTSPQEEIIFFKEIRPKILAYKLQVSVEYNISVNEPIGTSDVLINYFEEAIKGFQSVFKLNSFYYQYYRNHFSELDHLYFIRNADHSQIPLPEITDTEHNDSTPMSDLFAKFIAFEQVNQMIINRITFLMNNSPVMRTDGDFELRWTGDVINAVELAYGIWLTGQVNDGNASLNQIVRWIETNLKVSIGIAQRKFSEISRRKRLSITKFIDQMRSAIQGKADEHNS